MDYGLPVSQSRQRGKFIVIEIMLDEGGRFLRIHQCVEQPYGQTAKQRRQQVKGLSPAIVAVVRQLFYI